MSTAFHAKYFAHALTCPGRQGVDRLSQSLFNASVDLNPHQVEAALFALRSPLSKGVLLADEVGLGKTIEAGLVLCQFWAERKRRLLVICPASLRKQWQIELKEKFNLPALVVDARVYRKAAKAGASNPLETPAVIITSYHYAARMAAEIGPIPWDLAVIDEAHKLRNAHRTSNKIGQALRWALEDRKKILLTATPLQNSLTELFGITSIIDDQLFGDLPTFRTLYANADGDLDDLRNRIRGYCTRTLRRDVQEYIRFTERKLVTVKFTPTDNEHKLYEAVSAFLQRPDSYAIPQQQRHLTVIVVRKVLASSPVALASTLEIIRDRLISLRNQATDTTDITDRLLSQDDIDEDLLEELLEELESPRENGPSPDPDGPEPINAAKLEAEIREIEQYIRWARSLGIDTKTRNLLRALEVGFEKLHAMGAAAKAVIFTESRRTQDYLKHFLEANGYAGQIVTFSGTNRGPDTTRIYEQWLADNHDTGRIANSRPIDIRHAIIDHFQHKARVMIATEAAGEGVNLQFCSLLINFDLPWNPQRIEQRIGRIHRYGQKHDVVVINFLNERNAADQRVYELLRHKFCLFEGVFGASDDVLGQLESSAALERRILDLYQQCRTTAEIETSFQQLQQELDAQIQLKIADTRRKLLEHFDEDVHARIRIDYDATLRALDAVGRRLWRLTRFILDGRADFNETDLTFRLRQSPIPEAAPPGLYTLNRKRDIRQDPDHPAASGPDDGANLYRLSHPLGEHCIAQGKALPTEPAHLRFDLSGYDARLAALEPLAGRSGWLILNHLTIESLDHEEYLLLSGHTEDGHPLDHDLLEQLFRLDAALIGPADPGPRAAVLAADAERFAQATIRRSLEANNTHFLERCDQLTRWAEDVVKAAERDLALIKAEVRAANRAVTLANSVEEQKTAQETVRELERKKRRARQRIFEIEDDIEAKRDALIAALEKKMVQRTNATPMFMLQWTVQ